MSFVSTSLWSNSAAVDIWIRQIGGVQSGKIVGVQSATVVDVDNYDEDIYRDTSDLSYPWPVTGLAPLNTVGASVTVDTKITEAGVLTNTATIPDGHILSGDDRQTHTPPKPTFKKRSMILFWSGANGAGNVVASSWADEYMGCSTAPFTSIS